MLIENLGSIFKHPKVWERLRCREPQILSPTDCDPGGSEESTIKMSSPKTGSQCLDRFGKMLPGKSSLSSDPDRQSASTRGLDDAPLDLSASVVDSELLVPPVVESKGSPLSCNGLPPVLESSDLFDAVAEPSPIADSPLCSDWPPMGFKVPDLRPRYPRLPPTTQSLGHQPKLSPPPTDSHSARLLYKKKSVRRGSGTFAKHPPVVHLFNMSSRHRLLMQRILICRLVRP